MGIECKKNIHFGLRLSAKCVFTEINIRLYLSMICPDKIYLYHTTSQWAEFQKVALKVSFHGSKMPFPYKQCPKLAVLGLFMLRIPGESIEICGHASPH